MNSPWVFSVEENDFESKVIQKSHQAAVVVDFWAPWCGPCRSLAPILERLVAERGGDVLLAKVNIDEAQELAMQYRVESIPMVMAFRNGRPVFEFIGLLPETEIKKFLDQVAPTQADRKAQKAAALEKSDPIQAEKLYRQALQEDANHETATLGLARVLLARGADGEVAELLERVGPGGEQGVEAERLSAIHWLRRHAQECGDEATLRARLEGDPNNPHTLYDLGCVEAAGAQYAEALEKLLQAGQRDPKLAKSKVKETMVKVFHAVGARSPLADEYRDKLASILY
ncbi:MAG: thioredoxin [Gemmataceae bacterium]|nr:thioredoxin [Gemmataceae bacterium]MCI0742655.1 thioredoxin [Gemmataceae bacterium]